MFPFILSFFPFLKRVLGWNGGCAAAGWKETIISKYVNNFGNTNPTTLILSSLVSDFHKESIFMACLGMRRVSTAKVSRYFFYCFNGRVEKGHNFNISRNLLKS